MTKPTAADKSQNPESRQKYGKNRAESEDSTPGAIYSFIYAMIRYTFKYPVTTCLCHQRKGSGFICSKTSCFGRS
jgi:hypothetical protein